MSNFRVRNVNDALREGFQWLRVSGVREESRNGPVIVAPQPVMTTYERPIERVLFNPVRDANPAFHLMEAIWMMAGDNSVEFLEVFNSQFVQYAEDDGVVHGAYGFRWRERFRFDQIHAAIEMLAGDPETRRVVLQMWDCDDDMGANKRDIPCNTHIYFDRRGGALNMTVCNRSNDILWGAYGANAVHMSVLQEVIAAGVRIPVGVYRQFSNNYHAYLSNKTVQHFMDNGVVSYDIYKSGFIKPMALIAHDETVYEFLTDCEVLVAMHSEIDEPNWNTRFFDAVAWPMFKMYTDRKEGKRLSRAEIMSPLPGNDWLHAFADWCERRDMK